MHHHRLQSQMHDSCCLPFSPRHSRHFARQSSSSSSSISSSLSSALEILSIIRGLLNCWFLFLFLVGVEQDTGITVESECPSTESNAVVVPGIELCVGLVTATSNSVNEASSAAVENATGAGAVPNNPFAELLSISPKLVNKRAAKKRKVSYAVVVTASLYKNELLKCRKDKVDKVVRLDERNKKAQAKKLRRKWKKK